MNMRVSSPVPGVLAESKAARVSMLAAQARFSLRARGDLAPLDAALGMSLPDRIGARAASGEIETLRLGPDEWTILAPITETDRLVAACAGVYASHPHSLVDISGREVTLLIEGPQAAELLTLGCARDIETIAIGEGRRTIFDGVTVVLWRDAENRFRMDVWNSFVSHLGHLLETGCKELAADIA
ncbi:Sarcosine oxidase subunit gamma [Agrobacterium fabrum]|uniref:sarcosine oxidase subunit gamma n=1 Tax=Agrobacterium fabrum TaxID=1176649 RepID=UPI001D7F8C99|nr:sarcosine oxidase subunit gamma family protein [Agrobacterium fabrum]CAH0249440.1 Sarcosine oxidase subunit gamma [Agrobacterium fabrum]CAH0249571.1 Sarcosine oxidase subunit gamma [Agrobacterium fabrum]